MRRSTASWFGEKETGASSRAGLGFGMTWRHALCVAVLVGCGPDSPPARSAPPPAAPPVPEGAASDADDAEGDAPAEGRDDVEEPPAYGEGTLDEMDQAALEAACMQGSTAACDRLGH